MHCGGPVTICVHLINKRALKLGKYTGTRWKLFHQRLTLELGLRFARDGEETDHVNKIVLLWEGLHALPPASQALCHTNQLASLEPGRGFPCTYSSALLHPADMIYGLSMQWSMGKSFSVLHLPIKCFHSLPTTGESAVLVPQTG